MRVLCHRNRGLLVSAVRVCNFTALRTHVTRRLRAAQRRRRRADLPSAFCRSGTSSGRSRAPPARDEPRSRVPPFRATCKSQTCPSGTLGAPGAREGVFAGLDSGRFGPVSKAVIAASVPSLAWHQGRKEHPRDERAARVASRAAKLDRSPGWPRRCGSYGRVSRPKNAAQERRGRRSSVNDP